jgi:hypothetical protein
MMTEGTLIAAGVGKLPVPHPERCATCLINNANLGSMPLCRLPCPRGVYFKEART